MTPLAELSQRRRDRREFAGNFRAQTVDRGDNHQRDTGGDQRVFDRCCAAFVSRKSLQNLEHLNRLADENGRPVNQTD